ncbi:hypothetical protein [Psychromonas sp. Urea-02u-13]|uniref:hypothetical protein n=1 Tax=Psychromonas sp. Urea-02u-13 TaxID=2058326 RepID=UPI000C33BC7F|nr:hypothetical protein [Psychromonas sp. Urea-02u-13]PKG38208.1 hypothetical protein CXF74_14720 [Psychromonas sp. Urea-02u-13]
MFRYSSLLILFFSFFTTPSYSTEKIPENSIIAGTTLKVRLAEPIDSRTRRAGYRVKMKVDTDIEVAGKVVIKSGSTAQAIINKIRKAGRGSHAPEIILTLTKLSVNNRQVNVQSFPIAGKGTTNERKEVGHVDENENIVFGKQGEKITASIAVITKGADIIVSEGSVVYFILKETIPL